MQGFESVAHELEQKRLGLEQELAAARGRLQEIQADLERVHEAMAALTGQKRKSRSKKGAKKPVPTVHDLLQHIAKVREEHPFAYAGELEKAVRARVQAGGGSLSGFKALFAEALLTSPGDEANGQTAGLPHSALAHGAAFAPDEDGPRAN